MADRPVLMSAEEAYAARGKHYATPEAAHAVAREQHRRCVEAVRAVPIEVFIEATRVPGHVVAPWDAEAVRAAVLRALEGEGPDALAAVPRGHCGRCDRCGWPLFDNDGAGCWPSNCSMRPMPELRSHCAGCGAPHEGAEHGGKERDRG